MSEKEGLSRARLVSEALALVQEEGLEALSMRALANRLNVKAASLYWHVRDRRELLELLAESILDRAAAPSATGWRDGVLRLAAALQSAIASQQDAGRILLEVPDAIRRSDAFGRLRGRLETAGLQGSEAEEVALMVMAHVISRPQVEDEPVKLGSGATASIAVDSGSRGVVLRHGTDMETLIRVPSDAESAAPAIVRGETVKVRRLRGVGLGEIELNPRHPWRFQIQGATWNTVVEAGALDVREIKLDSGATKVECFLPRPRGVVPIIVSGGVVGLTLHRPPGVAVMAHVSGGTARIKLDAFSATALTSDLHWESAGASASADRYELRINGGAVQVTLDDKATPFSPPSVEPERPAAGEAASALDILLDGVEKRASSQP
ncbi:MAG TPA: TetR family transcriptional regulator [Candidatus Acidoferrum sp.]|nr:TetR family transcriptional regulator [Candidatus Acidoferrum sp.]